jgi:hypothetical protein
LRHNSWPCVLDPTGTPARHYFLAIGKTEPFQSRGTGSCPTAFTTWGTTRHRCDDSTSLHVPGDPDCSQIDRANVLAAASADCVTHPLGWAEVPEYPTIGGCLGLNFRACPPVAT